MFFFTVFGYCCTQFNPLLHENNTHNIRKRERAHTPSQNNNTTTTTQAKRLNHLKTNPLATRSQQPLEGTFSFYLRLFVFCFILYQPCRHTPSTPFGVAADADAAATAAAALLPPFRATGLFFRGCSQTTRFQTHSPTEKPQTANVFAVRQRAQNGECLAPRSVPAVSQPVCFSVLCVFRPFFRTQQKTARTKQNRKPVRTREYYTRWDARTHARLNTGERPGWYAVSNVWC